LTVRLFLSVPSQSKTKDLTSSLALLRDEDLDEDLPLLRVVVLPEAVAMMDL
jgi:hypothetical protein